MPIFLFLNYITKNKHLHVREKDVEDFIEFYDSYYLLLRRLNYVQNSKHDTSQYYSYICKHKIPISTEEINDIADFHNRIIDKYSKRYCTNYHKRNPDLNFVRWQN